MIVEDLIPYEFKREAVPVDEYKKGAQILIQEWNGEQAMRFNHLMYELNANPEDKKEFVFFMSAMVACSAIKENGDLLVNPKHYKELARSLPFKALERCYDVAARFNGFTPAALKNAKKD